VSTTHHVGPVQRVSVEEIRISGLFVIISQSVHSVPIVSSLFTLESLKSAEVYQLECGVGGAYAGVLCLVQSVQHSAFTPC